MPAPLADLYADQVAMVGGHDMLEAQLAWYRLVMVKGRGHKSFPVYLHEGTDPSVLETFGRSVLPLPSAPKP